MQITHIIQHPYLQQALALAQQNAIITYGIITVSMLYAFYRFITRPSVRKPINFFDKFKSKQFQAARRKTFPPPYSNGWYPVCALADLDNNRIQTVSAFGQELVVFRNESTKQIGVLDAFCPHLGAHLGENGRIVDGRLQCPFHGWEFNTEGKCEHIPYCTSKTVPTTAKTNAWTHCIWLDMVFVWFDADQRPPQYQLAEIPELTSQTTELRSVIQTPFHMSLLEMAMNAADYFHFNYLHAPLPLPIIGRFFTVRYDTEFWTSDDESKKHESYFNNVATVYFLNRFPLHFTKQLTFVRFEGPTIIHFHIELPKLGFVHLVKTLLPIKPFELHVEDRWYAQTSVPRILSTIISAIAKGAVEQDRVVWENKIYQQKPNLVPNDGPFLQQQRWWKQFYSEGSAKYAESLEW